MLNAFCLVCCVLRTYYIDSWGHKMTTVISMVLLTIFLFLVGTLTKGWSQKLQFAKALKFTKLILVWSDLVFRNSSNTSGVYSTVAMIFLSQGTYSFGWTPFLFSYPPEVNYPIRTNGMGVFQFFFNGAGYVVNIFPHLSLLMIMIQHSVYSSYLRCSLRFPTLDGKRT